MRPDLLKKYLSHANAAPLKAWDKIILECGEIQPAITTCLVSPAHEWTSRQARFRRGGKFPPLAQVLPFLNFKLRELQKRALENNGARRTAEGHGRASPRILTARRHARLLRGAGYRPSCRARGPPGWRGTLSYQAHRSHIRNAAKT
jgi:hypothetical protein